VTAAATLLLVFAFGFMTGALALYTVWRVAVCSPSYWLHVFKSIADIFPPGRWMRLHDDHLVMHCPHCQYAESSDRQ